MLGKIIGEGVTMECNQLFEGLVSVSAWKREKAGKSYLLSLPLKGLHKLFTFHSSMVTMILISTNQAF